MYPDPGTIKCHKKIQMCPAEVLELAGQDIQGIIVSLLL